MAMSMAIFMFAGLLLLVAVTGGGFEVKELKVPKVGRSSRIASFACSVLVLGFGIYQDRPAEAKAVVAEQKPQKSVEAPAPAPAPAPSTEKIIVVAHSLEEGMAMAGHGAQSLPAVTHQDPRSETSPVPAVQKTGGEKKQTTKKVTPAPRKVKKEKAPLWQRTGQWLKNIKKSAR